MTLGILEDTKLQHVPGTVAVLDDDRRSQEHGRVIDANLKYDFSGLAPVILVPQPSDDPKDPLTWPLWKRDMILGVLCLAAVIAATLTSLLSANTLTLALHFRRTFNDMALLTGWHLFGIGVAGLLFVPTARVWGKRHLYLLGLVIIVIGSIWGGSSGSSYRSLVWARVIQGVGLAPFEALLNASVGDLFFVHERGKRMALSNVALFGGAFLTPVIVGKMTHSIGWQWTFYFVAIFEGALLPVVYFLVPETSYRRPAHLNTDVAITMLGPSGAPYPRPQPAHPQPRTDKSTGLSADDVSSAADHEEPGSAGSGSRKEEHGVAVPASFGGRVALFVKLFLRPFPLFLQPAVAWACVVQGVLIGWTVLIGIVIAAVLLGPPLFFDEEKTGYMYSGAFVGAILGYIIAGLSADSSARYLIRRNRGVYEPEFRIWLVVPQLVFGCAGLYGFGVVAADTGRYGWFWLDFFFCLVVIGMVIGAVSSALYLVDAHRDIAVESFTCLMVFKNMFAFALTWDGYNWIVKKGIKRIFFVVSSIQVVVCLLSVLMYIYGKRNRSFFARYDIFAILRLR